MTVQLRGAAADELATVESLLEGYGLPTADVRDGEATFYLAEADGRVVGVGGLEVADSVALLRSVAVRERGQGHGSAICDGLEHRARAAGVEALYLLTESAPAFFGARGYERIDRETAPPSIQRTREFDALCGDSAVCMRKPL